MVILTKVFGGPLTRLGRLAARARKEKAKKRAGQPYNEEIIIQYEREWKRSRDRARRKRR